MVKVVPEGQVPFDYTGTGTGIGNFTLSRSPAARQQADKTSAPVRTRSMRRTRLASRGLTWPAWRAATSAGSQRLGRGHQSLDHDLGTVRQSPAPLVDSRIVDHQEQGFWSTHRSIMHVAWFGGASVATPSPA